MNVMTWLVAFAVVVLTSTAQTQLVANAQESDAAPSSERPVDAFLNASAMETVIETRDEEMLVQEAVTTRDELSHASPPSAGCSDADSSRDGPSSRTDGHANLVARYHVIPAASERQA